jgi:hypothetical protein
MKHLFAVIFLTIGVVAAEFTRPLSCFSMVVSTAAARREARGGFDGKGRPRSDR